MSAKKIFHKVEEGTFEKDKKEYKYVIEQDKNLPLEKSARVRITKVTPVVDKIRTRYEPHVEVDGDAGAFVPSYFGYDPKRLKFGMIMFSILTFMMVELTTSLMFGFSTIIWIMSFIPKTGPTMSAMQSKIFSEGTKILFLAAAFFIMWLPSLIRGIQSRIFARKLKKEGLSYEEMQNGVGLDKI